MNFGKGVMTDATNIYLVEKRQLLKGKMKSKRSLLNFAIATADYKLLITTYLCKTKITNDA